MNMTLQEMISHMGFVAWAVVITLLILSVYSITVMIDRWRTFCTDAPFLEQCREVKSILRIRDQAHSKLEAFYSFGFIFVND